MGNVLKNCVVILSCVQQYSNTLIMIMSRANIGIRHNYNKETQCLLLINNIVRKKMLQKIYTELDWL